MKNEFIEKIALTHSSVKQDLVSLVEAEKFIDDLLGLLFPHFGTNHLSDETQIIQQFEYLENDLNSIITQYCESRNLDPKKISSDFFKEIDSVYESLLLDARAIFDGDPAARSIDEVIIAYPGFFAISVYRLANWFYRKDLRLFPRILTEYAHKQTGIDIHPGATIGKSFCIDHGTGVVIGETTQIHDNVQIYQGVTLGGLTVGKSMQGDKRHPTIEENVILYANATILGGETVIGKDSIIGGNVWLTSSVKKGSKVYHKSDLVIK